MTTIKEETGLNCCRRLEMRKNFVTTKVVRPGHGQNQGILICHIFWALQGSVTPISQIGDLLDLWTRDLWFCSVLPRHLLSFTLKKQKTKQYRGIDHELSGNPIPEIHVHQSDLPDAAYIVHKFLKPTYSFSPSSTSNHILAPRSPREQPPNCTQQFH